MLFWTLQEMIMVRLTEDLENAEIQTLGRDEPSRSRRQPASRRSSGSRLNKVKKGNWKRGMHQRRNKRFAW